MKVKNNKMKTYFSEIKKELFERTVWPTRAEVLSQTVVVIILLVISASMLGLVDYIITFITKFLFEGSFVSLIFSSGILFLALGVLVLFLIVYFAIKYVRKNRYNR